MKRNGERYWDFGWQLVEGCTNCSPGCDNCWSLAKEKRFRKETGIVFHAERLDRPLKRKKSASYAIWNDLFHDDVLDGEIDETIAVIYKSRSIIGRPGHVFYLLTKRIHRAARYFKDCGERLDRCIIKSIPGTNDNSLLCGHVPPENLYLGVTVCNQQEADEKIPILLQIPAEKRWISIEPMLEYMFIDKKNLRQLSWVVVGAESGPHKRYCGQLWIEKIVEDCKSCNVPVFVKQIHKAKDCGFRLSKDITEWPESLRVREMD
jgi:protein gp37